MQQHPSIFKVPIAFNKMTVTRRSVPLPVQQAELHLNKKRNHHTSVAKTARTNTLHLYSTTGTESTTYISYIPWGIISVAAMQE